MNQRLFSQAKTTTNLYIVQQEKNRNNTAYVAHKHKTAADQTRTQHRPHPQNAPEVSIDDK